MAQAGPEEPTTGCRTSSKMQFDDREEREQKKKRKKKTKENKKKNQNQQPPSVTHLFFRLLNAPLLLQPYRYVFVSLYRSIALFFLPFFFLFFLFFFSLL
jgi:hypothetical protein